MSEVRARLENLPKLYPHLFSNGSLPWGFEIGDGWSDLIVALFARIGAAVKDAPNAKLDVRQIKEKFGALRFYYQLTGVDDSVAAEVDRLVQLAEAASARTCERCGRPGEINSDGGWLSARCEDCRGRACGQ